VGSIAGRIAQGGHFPCFDSTNECFTPLMSGGSTASSAQSTHARETGSVLFYDGPLHAAHVVPCLMPLIVIRLFEMIQIRRDN
jgi:hypothetical protein